MSPAHAGRLAERPRDFDPLAGRGGLGRRWHDFRLKEWVGFTLFHPELYGSMIIQDAKYLATSELYIHDRASGRLDEHAASGRRSELELPSAGLMFGGTCAFTARGFELGYRFDEDAGSHSIRVEIAATAKAQAIRGELILDAAGASAPLVVDTPLGASASMFTHKRIYPIAGTLTVGERAYRFDPARDLVIIDEHRSRLPYRTEWTWGTFALRTESGGIVGANFADREQPAGAEEESGIWVPDAVEPLSDVAFAPASADPLAPWTARSADGRLDVEFVPEGRKGVRRNFGIVAIDYFQLYGVYEGTVAGFAVRGTHGVLERMRMRS
ncbi:DUF2804 domain-containing protein [Gryllotalpicola daejeonensis]|uniref:DUF2804 domain-containing protein n=1 Tax=Gryllotalpicola daejeonensis TaxID=993087 RepID=A0ABP7ZEG4_9MICO